MFRELWQRSQSLGGVSVGVVITCSNPHWWREFQNLPWTPGRDSLKLVPRKVLGSVDIPVYSSGCQPVPCRALKAPHAPQSCLQIKASKQSLLEFWLHLQDEFRILSDKVKLILLPFSTTYLREVGISTYTAANTEYRSCFNAEPVIRLQLSVEPKIWKLCLKNI